MLFLECSSKSFVLWFRMLTPTQHPPLSVWHSTNETADRGPCTWSCCLNQTAILTFCWKYAIKPLPASQLTLCYFCTEHSGSVSYAMYYYITPSRSTSLPHREPCGRLHLKGPPAPLPVHDHKTLSKVSAKSTDAQSHSRYFMSSEASSPTGNHLLLLTRHSSGQPSHLVSMAFYKQVNTHPRPSHYLRHLHLLRENVTIHKGGMEITTEDFSPDLMCHQ